MNKKGFAISVVLYVIVFLIIAIFYVLLGIVKSRYSVNDNLKNGIENNLNSIEHMYSKLDNDTAVSVLRIDPNGGSVVINGETMSDVVEIMKYANETLSLPTPTRANGSSSDTYTLTYDANGGDSTPSSQSIDVDSTTIYNFVSWSRSNNCGSLEDGVYTFPLEYGVVCTVTATWDITVDKPDEAVTLANGINKLAHSFAGWKSSYNNNTYQAGASYVLSHDTTMTAQWELDAWSSQIGYDNSRYCTSDDCRCTNTQCAIDKLSEILK